MTLLAIAATVLTGGHGTFVTRLEMRNGVPVFVVNGRPTAPMMFWGYRAARPVAVGRRWQNIRFSFVAPCDDESATIHVHLALATGTVWIDDVELLESDIDGGKTRNVFAGGDFEGGEEQLKTYWNFFVGHGARAKWSIDCKVAHSGRCSLRVDVERGSKVDWHVHVYSKRSPIRRGKKYTVSLWIRSNRDRWPITCCVMRLNPYRVYGVCGDSFSETVRIMSARGFHIYSMPMPLPWPEPGKEPDFSYVDEQMEKLLADDPQALLLPRISVEPPAWWAKKHPDQMLAWENGKTDRWVSVASEVWLRDVSAAIRKLVRHLEGRWGDHIIGYHPAAQNSAEWYYPIWYHTDWGLMNFEPAFEEGWRKWLVRRYRTIESLNEAWGTNYRDFDEIRLPTAAERRSAGLGVFRDPRREMRMLDFTRYQNEAMADALCRIARAFKEACGGRKLVYAFYGYTFELSGCRYGIAPTGHLCLKKVLRSPWVDVICGPLSYYDRQVTGSGPIMAPAESINSHGKVWLNEDDTRTYLSAPNAGFGRTSTREETLWVHRRNFTVGLVHRSQMWFMDQDAGWLCDPAIWDNLARLRGLYEALYRRPEPLRSDVAVIVDEEGLMALGYGISVTRPLLYEMRAELNRMGTTPMLWLLSDFIEGRVPGAKLYLFLDAFWLDASRRRAILDRLRGSGATAVWFYAPGFLSERGPDPAAMRELTGFDFEVRRGKRSTRMTLTDTAGTYARGIGADRPIGPDTKVDPTFAVRPDGDVKVLGRYADGGVAFAERDYEGFKSVFIGTLKVPWRLLANMARAAGVHLYTESGDVIHTDGRVLSVTACTAGNKTIVLPRAAKVLDALSGKLFAEGKKIEVYLRKGETRVFLLSEM